MACSELIGITRLGASLARTLGDLSGWGEGGEAGVEVEETEGSL